MATIGQHISNVRGLIKHYGRTDENYTDQFLYNLLNGEKNAVLEDTLMKQNHASEWYWKQYCIRLIKTKAHNCDCVPTYLDKCLVVRSEYKLPQPIAARNKSYVSFITIGGEQINLYSQEEWLRIVDLDEIKTKQLAGTIINGYLYIWNNTQLKAILVRGLWQDVTDWQSIPSCTEDGEDTTNACFNPLTQDFDLDSDKQNFVYTQILRILNIPMSIQQDLTNDSNESLKV